MSPRFLGNITREQHGRHGLLKRPPKSEVAQVEGILKALDPRIQRVLAVLKRDFRQRIKVGELAKDVGLSASRLQHIFHKETGKSIKTALKEIRLCEAMKLLGDLQLSIKQICFIVGYCCPTDLGRDIRLNFGGSPVPFRRNSRIHRT